MGEVGAVGIEQRTFVTAIRIADRCEERLGGRGELVRGDKLLRDLVEVSARPLYSRPPRLPLAEEQVVLRRPDDLIKMLENQEELCELVERLEAVPEIGAVAVLREHPIAE